MKELSFSKIIWSVKQFLKKIWPQNSQKFVYVAIGDSTVEGIGASHPQRSYAHIIYSSILQTHKKATYHNLGKNGAPIRKVIETQLEEAIKLKPDLITISVGANDIRLHTKLSDFEKELKYLIEKIQKETKSQIVINNIPDFSTTKVVPGRLKSIAKILIVKFNDVIYKTAKSTNIIYVDLHTQSKIYAKFYPEAISQEDDFHPSDFGYALWANTIITSIQHILLSKRHLEPK